MRARARALVRRGGARRLDQLAVANLRLDRATRDVRVDGDEITVTPREIAILEHLMLHRGEVVARTTLLGEVFGMQFDPGSNIVDVNVARLRKKLTAAGARVRIVARRGVGFMIVESSGNAEDQG
jgi:DNA-binding response OmpR family regulator